jgi:hypothetical protein
LGFLGIALVGDRVAAVVTQRFGEDFAVDCPADVKVFAAFE